MATYTRRQNTGTSRIARFRWRSPFRRNGGASARAGGRSYTRQGRGAWALLIMVGALIAFELFNFSTTEYALGTFFGVHDTLGLASWATVLAIAFCGIDFAGLSRLFTREVSVREEPREVWLLTGAWLLGALMNAVMTWWAVANTLIENPLLGNELISRQEILSVVPIFVAVLVWLTRIMLIGTIGVAGERFLAQLRGGRAGTISAATVSPARSTSARPKSLPGAPQLLDAEPAPAVAKRASEQQANTARTNWQPAHSQYSDQSPERKDHRAPASRNRASSVSTVSPTRHSESRQPAASYRTRATAADEPFAKSRRYDSSRRYDGQPAQPTKQPVTASLFDDDLVYEDIE